MKRLIVIEAAKALECDPSGCEECGNNETCDYACIHNDGNCQVSGNCVGLSNCKVGVRVTQPTKWKYL